MFSRKFPLWLAAVVAALCSGCTYLDSLILADWQSRAARNYVIIVPDERADRDYVAQFATFKQGQGFDVSVLTFSTALPVDDRIAQVRELLSQARPANGQSAYALIMASDWELPLGPWRVSGLDAPISSDLPLFLAGKLDRYTTLEAKDWRAVLAPDFPWIFGRLPFSDDAVLGASVQSTMAFAERDKTAVPFALLGAERFDTASDSALVMNQAKMRFLANRWGAELCATDPPADRLIDPLDTANAVPPELMFIERWSRKHPQVVYAIAHTGDVGLGDYLISYQAYAAINSNYPEYSQPATPAVLITTACSTGYPDNALLNVLFARGWAVGFIGSTETNGPHPLLPAILAEINTGDVLSRGVPLGLAVRAIERTYYVDSQGPLGWVEQDAETKAKIASNIVSYVVYGDPSLRCGNGE